MRFKDAVEKTDDLAEAYESGLQALKSIDRRRIQCQNPRDLTGSVDLDGALRDSHPNDPRWDYGIGVRETRGSDRVIWIEVHPASSSHIQDVLSKFRWLRQWLTSSASWLNRLSAEYVWIASGSVRLPKNSPQRKKLAAQGIRFEGNRLQVGPAESRG